MRVIPVVDVAEHLAGGDSTRAASEIEAAIIDVGFFQIVGHGVERGYLDAVYEAVAAMSALPAAVKERLLSPSGHPYRGLHLKRDEAGVVRQERFLATRYDDPAEAIANGVAPELADFFDPNVWPSEVPALRTAVRDLFVQSQDLGGRMMDLFALALGLEHDYFADLIEPNASSFAANIYPARRRPLDVDPTVLFAEHSDGNTLTILHQRGDYEGLEVQRIDAEGEWIPVPVDEDAFVINVGELMTRWTNDHWPATKHRVVASPDPQASRTTLTTFHMPALDTVVAPLQGWVGADGPHYEPVNGYEWERTRIRDKYSGTTDATGLRPSDKVGEFARKLAR
jgi:isopenicillin N synthase-like dioxygenase